MVAFWWNRSTNSETIHHEYLAPYDRDARRELIEHLLERLGDRGSIVVYSSFEKTQLSALAKRFPDLSERIISCIERLFDIERVFKSALIHPEFCGRTSIKSTLPALVPSLNYKSMIIGDGDAATAAFAKMAKGKCANLEIQQLREDLLTYCHQDTLAMVKLHEVIQQL